MSTAQKSQDANLVICDHFDASICPDTCAHSKPHSCCAVNSCMCWDRECMIVSCVNVSEACARENKSANRDAFENWWDNVGSAMAPVPCEDAEDHAHSICRAAWEAAKKDGA